MSKVISDSLNKLILYIENQDYKGFDPYDALKSPLFKLPFFRTNKFVRFFTQQFGKRFPINLRPLLFVPKGYNPVTLGLCIQAYSYLFRSSSKEEYLQKIDFLITELRKLIPNGYSGACWGYDFDWEARYAQIPAYQPTVVATGIITNALFECYRITKNEHALNLCKSAISFILNDLNRYETETEICFSYSPFDHQQVFNASMKGARLLSQVYSVTGGVKLREIAQKTINFVVNKQNTDGSWFYSTAQNGNWIDNYHTGYILDCLDEYIKCTEDTEFQDNLKKGFAYYCANFVTENGIPKFYNNKTFPVDCTAAGQTILTLNRLGETQLAKKVATYMIESMQHKSGYFYFRKYKYHTEKTSFMRWSNAWMMLALASIYSANNQ